MRIAVVFLTTCLAMLSLANAIHAQDLRLPLVAPKPVTELDISVKVVDLQGKPIPSATIVIRKYTKGYTETERVFLDGHPFLRTDNSGNFRTPGPLAVHTAYVLEVSKRGYLPNISRWTNSKRKGKIALPDVVLRKLIAVEGTVKDRQGKPVAGVKVFQSGDGPKRTQDTTDSQGRFKVPGIPEGKAFLFAEKKDYRFTGQLIDTTKGDVTFELVTKDDPNPPVLKTLPAPDRNWTDKYRKQLAWKILKPRIDAFLTTGAKNYSDYYYLVSNLAIIDPVFFLKNLDRIEKANENNPDFDKEYLLFVIARNLAINDPEEAAAIMRSTQGTSYRVYYFRTLLESDRLGYRKRLQNAAEASLESRNIQRQYSKIIHLCFSVMSLLELKEEGMARSLLLNTAEIVRKLDPKDQTTKYARAYYAGTWAKIDTAIARMYSQGISPDFMMDDAVHFAENDPDYVEQIFQAVLNDPELKEYKDYMGYYLKPTCLTMSRKYPHRAEKLLQTSLINLISKETDRKFRRTRIFPWLKQSKNDQKVLDNIFSTSLVYLAMASQQANRNPVLARKFLQKGVDNLLSLKWRKKKESDYDIELTSARALAIFLPIAEKVDLAWANELFWHSLAIRMKPIAQETKDRENRDESLAVLAAMLARYDRDAAKSVIEPIIDRAVSRSQTGKPWTRSYYDYLTKAAYYADPKGMSKWIDKLPKTSDDPGKISAHRSAEFVYIEELLKPCSLASPQWKKYYDHAWDIGLSRTNLTSDLLLKDR